MIYFNSKYYKKMQKKNFTANAVEKVMDWVYDKAVNGLPGLDSAEEMAADYLRGEGSLREKVNSLIRWQNLKSGSAGLITGLGGANTLPVAVPADITCGLYIQIRMIAAIAKMGGYNLRDDRVKSLVFTCLVASSAADVVKQTGIDIAQKMAKNAIKKISPATIRMINHKVGFKLFTKFGERGAVNMGKLIPYFGVFLGGLCDLFVTNTIGNVARDTFIPIT